MSTGYVFFTGAACGMLLLAAAKLAISYRRQMAGRWLFLLLTGVFSYLVHPLVTPEIVAPEHILETLLLDLPTDLVPAAFWLFAFSLCSDSGKFPRAGWALITLSVAISSAANFGPDDPALLHAALYILAQPLKLSLLAAGLITLLRQFHSDLVEARRRLRAVLLIAVGAYMLIVVCAEFLFSYQPVPAGLPTLHALLASLLTLTACLWLLALSPTALDESLPPNEEREKKKAPLPAAPQPLDKPQRQLLEKLQAHMHAGGYRHTGLTIRELAEQLGAREHVLRALINRHLGYRNFNEYLNQFRIDEASRRLADPEQAHLPVLTIALDIGYRSLSPFNAAFKRRHKQTPTEYRREKLPLQEA